MVLLDRQYQYTGINPLIKGKVGNITQIVDEDFVIFSVLEVSDEDGTSLVDYRVKFNNLRLVN